MGTLIDKLNYLNETKEIFKEKMDSIGYDYNNDKTFRTYLDWTDEVVENLKLETDLAFAHINGYSLQNGTPTQNNPVDIITNTNGQYEIIKNKFNNSFIDNLISNQDSEEVSKFDITKISPLEESDDKYDETRAGIWVYFKNNGYLTIPSSLSDLKVSFYYTFNYPRQNEDEYHSTIVPAFKTEEVPFKIYLVFKDKEDQEIFASSDSDNFYEGIGYFAEFTIPIENNPIGIRFKNVENEKVLEGIGLQKIQMNETTINSLSLPSIEELAYIYNKDEEEFLDSIYYDSTGDNQGKNYFNKDNLNYNFSDFIKYHDPSWEDEDAFIYEINNNDTNTWQLTSLDNGIRIKCSETSTNNDLGIFYMLPNPRNNREDWYSLYETHFGAKFHVVGDRKPSLWVGQPNLAHNKFFLSNCIPDDIEETSGELKAGVWARVPEGCQEEIDNDYIIIGFGFSAGENATENDYIDYTNIRLTNGMWDFYPSLDVYVPYNKFYPNFVNYNKCINKKVLNGTEENWTCIESNTPGVYKIDLIEDENNPWHGKYYYEEYEEDIYDPETEEPTGETKTIINESRSNVLCSHFQDVYYKESEDDENGYCSFYGTGISFYTNQQTTLEEWKNWLQNNPITFYYILDDEYEEHYHYFEGEELFEIFNNGIKNEVKTLAKYYIGSIDKELANKKEIIKRFSNYQYQTRDYFTGKKIIQKALSLIGEDNYNSIDFYNHCADEIFRYHNIAKQQNPIFPLAQDIKRKIEPTQQDPISNFMNKYLYSFEESISYEYPEDCIINPIDISEDISGQWIDFNNQESYLIIPESYDCERRIVYFNYCFTLGEYSTTVVPFKIYLKDINSEEEPIEIYNSNGAEKGSFYYELFPKHYEEEGWSWDSDILYHLIFLRTDNNESLTNIGIINNHIDKINNKSVPLNLNEYELGTLYGAAMDDSLDSQSYSNVITSETSYNDETGEEEQTLSYSEGIIKKTFDGTENTWSCTATNISGLYQMKIEEDPNNPWQAPSFIYTDPTDETKYNIGTDVWCAYFKHINWANSIDKIKNEDFENGDCYFDGTSFYFYTNQQTTLEEWKTWLNENPITVYYGKDSQYITPEIITNKKTQNRLKELQDIYGKKRLQDLLTGFENGTIEY